MKILHTSDWHLGHLLYNYDRTEEQTAFLQQLAEIVRNEQPDAMLISGDIYHTPTPSAATQRMYTEGLLAIHQACPSMTIVAIAGNHDSSSKLEIDSCLWQHFQVNVIGKIERTATGIDLNKHIISVNDAQGHPIGYIVAIPHTYLQNIPMLHNQNNRDDKLTSFIQALLDETARQNVFRKPVVLMAHLAVEGSDRTGHDETVGDMEYIPLQRLGSGYDYLALGHIHCPQTLRGSHNRARYCGSPLPVNFNETYPHSVSIIELETGREPAIRTIDIQNPFPLITLPPAPLPFDEALEVLQAFPADRQGYVRLNVAIRDYLPSGSQERAADATHHKACKFCYVNLERQHTASTPTAHQVSIQDIQEKSPLEIAQLYYKENEGEEMDDELCALMREAIRQVNRRKSEA